MTDAADKSPQDEGKDIESPVDGPTPDWMRLATTAGSSGPSLTEENTPAWLKSIRSGKGLTNESKAGQPETPPAASSNEAMSDLERLLAEEGIDLGSVPEERPEGSSGMSARDWLISTSSEEMIRNKVGAEPLPEPPVAPDSEHQAAAPSDDKMVVQEDLPDWLQEIAEDVSEPESFTASETEVAVPVEDDQLVVRDELPDWLQDIAQESEAPFEVDSNWAEPVAAAAPTAMAADEDKMVVQDDLPDWLREVSAEPAPVELTSAAVALTAAVEPEKDRMVVDEDLPDWLREVGDAEVPLPEPVASMPETPPPSGVLSEDKMVVEDDLPDWLREVESETPESDLTSETLVAATPIAAAVPAVDDMMVATDELPDWLREVVSETPESDLTSETLVAATPVAAAVPTVDDMMVATDELPDWLREVESETPESDLTSEAPVAAAVPTVDDMMVATDELPDWLREVESETPESDLISEAPVAAAVPTVDDMMVATDELPDWLREVESEAPESDLILNESGVAAKDALENLENEADLPDWLREVEAINLAEVLQPTSAQLPQEPAEEVASMLSEERLDLDEDDLPDWLREVQENEEESAPKKVGVEPLTPGSDSLKPESGVILEEELPDWLRDVEAETPAFTVTPTSAELDAFGDTVIQEEELPDWLQEVQTVVDEAFEPSEPSPEPLAESVVGDDLVVAEELPDWLQDVEAELPQEPVGAETPELAVATTAGLVDEQNLPDWLKDVETPTEVKAELPAETKLEAIVSIGPISAEAEAEEPVEELLPEIVPVEPALETIMAAETPVVTGPSGIPDWLQKLREVEPEPGPAIAPAMPVVVPVAASSVAPAIAAQLPPTAAPVAVARNLEIPADAAESLAKARSARDKGRLEEALPLYESLVQHGAFLDKIIEDIQQAVKTQPANHLLYQLMGDAMMRDGRLQSALNAYREALSKL